MKKIITDGCQAVAKIAYKFSQVIPVYPITPSSPMAEYCTSASAQEETNLFNENVTTIEMQSEAGVAGAMHGALLSGALSTTFTSSQGLLLMLPNMFKIAGEHLPNVIHVASRTIASHALNIFCDHSDVMAVRSSGYTMLTSSSVQEAHDLALVSHLLSIKSNVPVLHFMDGFRTSHELQKIEMFEDKDLKKFISKQEIKNLDFVKNCLSPDKPLQYGTAQNPDTFFQNRVRGDKELSLIPEKLNQIFDDIYKVTGRKYEAYKFYGNPKAKSLIVAMGSTCQTLKEYIEKNNVNDVQVCDVKLFRPFIFEIPASVTNICVLDRCKENGAISPLALDVMAVAQKSNKKVNIIKGIYGLGGKDFTPAQVKAVISNMKSKRPIDNFTVGIDDDINFNSLAVEKDYVLDNKDEFSIKIFGLGSDGSVSASKSTVKILGEHFNKNIQGYFEYDSRKSGSMTISHIRISDKPIESEYLLQNSNVIMISNFSFVHKYDCLEGLKENGTVIFNSIFDKNEIGKVLPKHYTEQLKAKNANVYVINAQEIAKDNGLKEKINIIMMTALFKATNFMSQKKAKQEIEEQIQITFGKKGQNVVDNNIKAMNESFSALEKVDNASLVGKESYHGDIGGGEFSKRIQKPMLERKGNDIKVSAFSINGSTPTDTTQYEKRGIADNLPNWIKENCIQCGQCVLACPHSALRAILIDEKSCSTPEDFVKAIGIKDALYKIQLSPLDCTGCGVCANTCPAIKKALQMTSTQEILEQEKDKYAKYSSLKNINQNMFKDDFAKGLQFKKSYFEFSGACAGCGQTPYIKLASMLFGDRMIIANATGCSSIYAGTYGSCPYSADENGKGPAWANSLFEDNAEFGLGIKLANKYNNKEDKSVWIIGGDGWAYDIGFGGLDHVLASGENVNILVLDNQSYSNTGGQSSKATPMGANIKLSESSKRTHKKNLAEIAMTYSNVYVAEVALGADMTQCIKAFKEAEAHQGVSLIIAYSPCVNMGFDLAKGVQEQKDAVECGYWPLFRFNGETLSLDSGLNEDKFFDFLRNERRYQQTFKDETKTYLLEENKKHAIKNYNKLKNKIK